MLRAREGIQGNRAGSAQDFAAVQRCPSRQIFPLEGLYSLFLFLVPRLLLPRYAANFSGDSYTIWRPRSTMSINIRLHLFLSQRICLNLPKGRNKHLYKQSYSFPTYVGTISFDQDCFFLLPTSLLLLLSKKTISTGN